MGNITAYLFMLLTTFLYLYFIGGDASMIMLYMLILAPVLSVSITYLIKKEVYIKVQVPDLEVEKGGLIRVTVTVQNNIYLPIPFLDITFLKPENLIFNDLGDLKISLGPREKKIIQIEYLAMQRGVSRIGLQKVLLRDYLGFFGFALMQNVSDKEKSGEIVVIPRIVNLKHTAKILQNSLQTNSLSDEGDASTNIISWTGEPGYEFREYMPGDPLHKIHWKLSAKRELLMVRKDEGRAISKKRLILDPFIKFEVKRKNNRENTFAKLFGMGQEKKLKEHNLDIEEKILEALLSVANLMLKNNRETEIWVYGENGWEMSNINDSKSVNMLQHKLAGIKFVRNAWDHGIDRMPMAMILEQSSKSRAYYGGEAIVFTGNYDHGLKKNIAGFASSKISTDVVLITDASDMKRIENTSEHESIWVINPNEDLADALI